MKVTVDARLQRLGEVVEVVLRDRGWGVAYEEIVYQTTPDEFVELRFKGRDAAGQVTRFLVRNDIAGFDRMPLEQLVMVLADDLEKHLQLRGVLRMQPTYRICEVVSVPLNTAATKWQEKDRIVLYEGTNPQEFLRQNGRQLGQVGSAFPRKLETVLELRDSRGGWKATALPASPQSLLSVPKGPRQLAEELDAIEQKAGLGPSRGPTPWDLGGGTVPGRMSGSRPNVATIPGTSLTIPKSAMQSVVSSGPTPADLSRGTFRNPAAPPLFDPSPPLQPVPRLIDEGTETAEEAARRHKLETIRKEQTRLETERLDRVRRLNEVRESVLTPWQQTETMVRACRQLWEEAALFEHESRAKRMEDELFGSGGEGEADIATKWSLAEQEAQKLLEFAQARIEEARARREGRGIEQAFGEAETVAELPPIAIEEDYTEEELQQTEAQAKAQIDEKALDRELEGHRLDPGVLLDELAGSRG